MPKKICIFNGCNNIISYHEKYCNEHKLTVKEEKANHNKRYDKTVRNSKENKKYTEFYQSNEWEKLRNKVLDFYFGLDLYEYYINHEIVYASPVHHIEELKDCWDKRLDFNNMFPSSLESHGIIHKLYIRDKAGTQKILKELIEKFKCEFKNEFISLKKNG